MRRVAWLARGGRQSHRAARRDLGRPGPSTGRRRATRHFQRRQRDSPLRQRRRVPVITGTAPRGAGRDVRIQVELEEMVSMRALCKDAELRQREAARPCWALGFGAGGGARGVIGFAHQKGLARKSQRDGAGRPSQGIGLAERASAPLPSGPYSRPIIRLDPRASEPPWSASESAWRGRATRRFACPPLAP